MRLSLVTLLVCFFVAVNSDRLYSMSRNEDDFYSSYRVSPAMIAVRKPFAYRSYKASASAPVAAAADSEMYQPRNVGQVSSHRSFYRDVSPSPPQSPRSFRVSSLPRNLQASPSASVPFFYRNSHLNSKKVSKKVSATREKAINSPPVPKSQDTVDWSAEDMMQHPIDEAPRKSNRSLGLPCSYSSDCGSGCCLLDRETKIRSCQPLARMGDRCTKSQVKGDLYVDACPCMRGADLCSTGNRCSW